jgi:threo-3-hydroxy-L-aspartate ammonia-lyase
VEAGVAPPGPDDVRAAARRLAGHAHRTPIVTSRTLDEVAGARVFLKAENLQRVGAFKFRGAFNHLAAMEAGPRERGVVTASSGNHAQAVALAARLHGTRAVVLMPADAPVGKLAATRAYGAEVLPFDRYRDDRDALVAEAARRRGLHVVHAFDDRDVIAGQGTVGLELAEQVPELDVVVVPLGGGGLIAGCALGLAAAERAPRLVGVEPEARPAAREALRAGTPITVPVPRTEADGQQSARVGRLPLAIIQRSVDAVVGVSDDAIRAAMRLLFERVKLVVEPSGASALAAVLAGAVDVGGGRVGIVISGGNVDAERFARLV